MELPSKDSVLCREAGTSQAGAWERSVVMRSQGGGAGWRVDTLIRGEREWCLGSTQFSSYKVSLDKSIFN